MNIISPISVIFSGLLLLFTLQAHAAPKTLILFENLAEAQRECPAADSLVYKTNEPIYSFAYGKGFSARYAFAPKNVDANGKIIDAQFRLDDQKYFGKNIYGYMDMTIGGDDRTFIHCFYSYLGVNGSQVPIDMKAVEN